MRHPIFTFLFALLLSALPFHAAKPDFIVNKITIEDTHLPQTSQTIENMLPFKSGDKINQDDIDQFIRRLQDLQMYASVESTLKHTGQARYDLNLKAIPSQRVRGLFVKGNYPLLDKDIRKLLPLQPGTPFKTEALNESIDIIKRYLTKHGYYKSEVTIESKIIKKYNAIDLYIEIKKGHTYRIGEVVVNGNKVINTNRIRNELQHLTHFKLISFKKDLKKIKDLYIRKGYIKARVKLEDMTFDDQKHKVNITLTIRENKHLTILITGQTYLNKSHLKAVTKLDEQRSYDRYAIKTGKRRLEKYYKLRGFPHAKIDYKVIKKNKDEVIVKYIINAGQRETLKKIRLEGNKKFSDGKLLKKITLATGDPTNLKTLDTKKLNQNSASILKTYTDVGFFDAQISPPLITSKNFGDQKTVTYNINEGQSYKLASFKIESDLPVNKETLLQKSTVKAGKDYSLKRINETKDKILDQLQSQGFAYAQVAHQINIDPATKSLTLAFNIQRGVKVHVRSIIINGRMKTHESTILKNILIQKGKLFRYKEMLDSQLNLRKLGIFSSLRITPLGFEAQSPDIDLLITFVERQSIVTNLQVGFDSRNLAAGEINFTKHNIFGSGRRLSTRMIGGQKYDRGEISLLSPRIFGASWNMLSQVFVEYEDEPNFTSASYGSFINTLKNFGSRWTLGLKEQITRTELFESKSNVAALGNSLFDNTFNELQFSISYDRRDNFANPQKGYYALLRNTLNTDLSDATNNFNTYEFNLSSYYTFFKRFTLIKTVRLGHTVKITNNPRIPANKLFFLGGADTIRGFAEDGVNPTGGTVSVLSNTELNFRLTHSIKLAGFLDTGLLSNNINSIRWGSFRNSAGVGLRYFTPIGPLRFDWGFFLDRQTGEPSNKIHFSFGSFF